MRRCDGAEMPLRGKSPSALGELLLAGRARCGRHDGQDRAHRRGGGFDGGQAGAAGQVIEEQHRAARVIHRRCRAEAAGEPGARHPAGAGGRGRRA